MSVYGVKVNNNLVPEQRGCPQSHLQFSIVYGAWGQELDFLAEGQAFDFLLLTLLEWVETEVVMLDLAEKRDMKISITLHIGWYNLMP